MDGQDMTDYTELVKALRHCATRSNGCVTCAGCPMSSENGDVIECINALHKDAAAAIEELQAQLPKRGKWIKHPEVKNIYGGEYIECPFCGEKYVVQYIADEKFCRNCGADVRAGEERKVHDA